MGFVSSLLVLLNCDNMESHYDSDEEIAWGPLTLHEIRREFQKNPRKLARRQSDFGAFFHSASGESNTSGLSAYYTANNSLHPSSLNMSENQNKEFLNKLSQVIDGNVPIDLCEQDSSSNSDRDHLSSDLQNESFVTVPEIENVHKLEQEQSTSAQMDAGLADIINIFSDGKSLALDFEDTMLVSDNESDEREISKNTMDPDYSYMSDENEVIVITDSSTSTTEESDNNQNFYAVSSIKKERSKIKTPVKRSNFDMERVNLSQLFEKEGDYEVLHDTSFNRKDEFRNSSNNSFTSNHSENEPINQNTAAKRSPFRSPSSCNSSYIPPEKPAEFWENYRNYQDTSVSSVYSEQNESSESIGIQFNDTLEEMELALKHGLDYEMPQRQEKSLVDDVTEPLTLPHQHLKGNSAIKASGVPVMQQKKNNKYNYVSSPVGDYIKTKNTPGRSGLFKMPHTSVNKVRLTPSNLTNKHFKNIVSPVSVYIKNSPAFYLKQNVHATTVEQLRKNKKDPHSNVQANNDNVHTLVLPQVIYKPAKITKTIVENGMNLPPSIGKMVPKPTFTTHYKRVQKTLNNSCINKKLLEGNITLMENSFFNQTASEDVSFQTQIRGFIK